MLQFLRGWEEEDEDDAAALGDMEEDSNSFFEDGDVVSTESVDDKD